MAVDETKPTNHVQDIQIVPVKDIKINPNNRNKHPSDQIQRLSEIIQYQGFRQPLVISNQTGLLVVGHGRLAAAKKIKLKTVPVIYQDFTEDQETAYGISDNAIASWAALDFQGINEDIATFDGTTFSIDLLGIQNFTIDAADKEESTKTKTMKFIECPNCQTEFEYKQGNKRNV